MQRIRAIITKLLSPQKIARGRTVRYMFPLFVGFAAVMGAQLLSSVESSYVRLEIDKTSVRTDERFSIDVYAYAHVPVNAVDITLSFDGKRVKVLEVDRGQSVLTIWTEDPIITDNSVIMRGGTFRRGFIGEHKLATIDLQALATGNSLFDAAEVVLLAGDGQGTPVRTIDTSDSNTSLFVYDDNTSPGDISVRASVNLITDLDGDGNVTLRDISVFMGDWSNGSRLHDFNGDGRMTFSDFSILLANFFFD